MHRYNMAWITTHVCTKYLFLLGLILWLIQISYFNPLRCAQVEQQISPSFRLVRRCSRSSMSIVARANYSSIKRCAEFASSRRGLALNFSPRGAPFSEQHGSSCLILDCPELEGLSSLQRDSSYDYYSLYAYPPPPVNWTCVPGVGMLWVRTGRDRANYSIAGERCRDEGGDLAHIVSESRTGGLATLMLDSKRLSKKQSQFSRRAYVGLDDISQEGHFLTTAEEPLECFPFRAWGPGEPRSKSKDDDCVVLDQNRSWSVTNCSRKLPFICELYLSAASDDCSFQNDTFDAGECERQLKERNRYQGTEEDRCEGWDLLDVPPPTTTMEPVYEYYDYENEDKGTDEKQPNEEDDESKEEEDEDDDDNNNN